MTGILTTCGAFIFRTISLIFGRGKGQGNDIIRSGNESRANFLTARTVLGGILDHCYLARWEEEEMVGRRLGLDDLGLIVNLI